MSDVNLCPDCGAQLVPGDRFCGSCGFDLATLTAPADRQFIELSQAAAPSGQRSAEPGTQPITKGQPAGRDSASGTANSIGNKNALVVVISILAVLFLASGGLYWYFSQKEDPGITVSHNKESVSGDHKTPAPHPQADLTKAATYLSEPGLKCTFFVNYPDGMSGIVNRISGQAVPNEAVLVSEVETGIDRGEEYGFGFHYVERPDGTYYILDNTPNEIYPVLKNSLTVGQTWSYDTENGSIQYKVIDMGVDLDLGFTQFEDCVLVQEDNQIVDYQSITYYAPGQGSVYVIAPGGNLEYYKMTGMTNINRAEAANTIIKWCPNYKNIKDDRTQSF